MPCYLEDNVDRAARQGRVRRLDPRTAAAQRARLRPRRLGSRAQSRLQSAGTVAAAAAGRARSRLQAHARRTATASSFNALYTLANMPIQRFGSTLISQGRVRPLSRRCCSHAHRDAQSRRRDVPQPHLGRLARLRVRLRLQPDARPAAGARRDGRACTCPICWMPTLTATPIRVAGHCFGCTAGQGSSCGGALKEAAE